VAVLDPGADGVNVTAVVQLEVGVTGVPLAQTAVLIVKSAAFVPLKAGVTEKVRFAFPVFVIVSVNGEVVEPSASLPNARLNGLRETIGASATAVPLNATV
jgi:hypothetical protein